MLKSLLSACSVVLVTGLACAAQVDYAKLLDAPLLQKTEGTLGYEAILKEVDAADKAADAKWCALKSRAEYEAYRKDLHAKYVAAVGGLTFARTPLNAKVVATIPREGYKIEKVMFESRPGVYVTGLLYLPDNAKFKAPYKAIILTCGHSADGKGSIDYQRGCVQGVQQGFAVLIYDPISQGERVQVPGGICCGPHNQYGALAALLGQSTAQMRLWDGMRVIDYLYTRDDIRKDGVGCMGNSGGGTMTSLLESMDPRITTACPSCYITTLRDVCRRIGPQDAEQNIFGQLAFGLNHAGYVLMGGNAVRIHCCFKDFFWIEGTRASYDVVKKTVANCGLDATRYGLTDVPGPHGWKESTRTSSIQWMRRWLAGDTSTPPVDVEACRKLDVGFDVKKVDHGLDGKAVWVTPEGKVAKVPGFRSIYALLKDDLASAEKARPVRDAAARAQVAAARAGIRPLEQLGVRVTKVGEEKLADGATLVREIFSFADGQKVPALTFLPKGEVKGAVLVVDDRPQRSIHRARVPDVLKRGEAIMVADLACVGETGKVKFPFYGIKNADEGPAVMLYLLGKSMVGLRAEELIALGDALKARTGKKVEMIPHGRPCISAAHAFAVRPDLFKSVQCLRTPKSWGESVRTSAMVPFADVVNGALLDYDWTDLLK
ncbi:MAG: alpha/beta hydrolase family protein [Kiritimatiellae bacterium]|nr:alpha/beta hydrolase family protein [Kiritimatiellia bacterium]